MVSSKYRIDFASDQMAKLSFPAWPQTKVPVQSNKTVTELHIVVEKVPDTLALPANLKIQCIL